MSQSIVVEEVSKSYVLGAAQRETMLRGQLTSLLRAAFRKRAPREKLWALSDVSFGVEEGEVVGIIGRNGAGKSTLLKILSRITFPTSGRVRVAGRVASLLEVGTGFHEELTGRENILLNGSILGMKRAEVESKLEAIASYAGVERFLDTPIKRYSSGMRLRLGFAVAAHLDPDVLIVDEVLAVGDAGFQKKCLNTMEGLRSSGRTVLFVSHNMAAVENLCTRAIWIDGGRVRIDGPTHSVIREYMSTFAGGQGGSVDLRDLPSRRGGGRVRFTAIEFLDAAGVPLAVIRSGDHVTFRLRYRAEEALANLSFGIRLTSELGTVITETSTRLHNIDIPRVVTGDGFLDLEIGALNLLSGRYYITAGVVTRDGALHDVLENCARIDIEAADVFGSGQTVDSRHGIVFFPQRWKLEGVQTYAGKDEP